MHRALPSKSTTRGCMHALMEDQAPVKLSAIFQSLSLLHNRAIFHLCHCCKESLRSIVLVSRPGWTMVSFIFGCRYRKHPRPSALRSRRGRTCRNEEGAHPQDVRLLLLMDMDQVSSSTLALGAFFLTDSMPFMHPAFDV